MKDLIKKLVETYGPSGDEEAIRRVISQEVRGYVSEVHTDALGNLIAVKKGKGARVMVAAHMDEVGFVATYIDEKGFIRFSNIGGISPFTLIGERVIFSNGTIGAFGFEKLDDMKDLKLAKMFIDIGATDGKETSKLVNVGDMACYYREMSDLGDRLVAKSMDDRIGCAVVIQAMKELKENENELYFVFTVQEEVGLRGARTSAYKINPSLGIAVDVTLTGDTPEAPTMAVRLGAGPAIKVKDASVVTHPRVKQLMMQIARDNGIPYQMEVLESGGTDAGSMHLAREGVPSGVISIPARYVHTPSEMVDYNDVRNCVTLLVKILEQSL